MRDYGKISPQFWIGKTGKALRGNAEAQVLAVYLMTSPHANMIGLYHCPIAYMAHETGLTLEGASKALECLIQADFCTFDAVDEYVFVHQFALHQVGESLLPADRRCKGVENELARVPKNQCWQAFRARYAEPYNLTITAQNASPLEAPTKPLASQKQKQKQKQKQEQAPSDASPSAQPAKDSALGSRLPADWTLPADWQTWAESERPDLDPEATAERFRDFWLGKVGKDGRKVDWQATWRNWVRNERAPPGGPKPSAKSMFAGCI
jgi:hypothetical protein